VDDEVGETAAQQVLHRIGRGADAWKHHGARGLCVSWRLSYHRITAHAPQRGDHAAEVACPIIHNSHFHILVLYRDVSC
jgi:hypothetical protein